MKTLKFVAFTFVAMVFAVTSVNAAEVNSKSGLLECLANGGTCTLTADVELDERLVVSTGKTVVLDLNGKTLDLTHERDNYSALIQGNLTVKGNGTFNITNYLGFGVTGTLTIENGTFNHEEGTYLIGNWGTTTIKNGAFNGGYNVLNAFSGTGVVENGTFSTKPEADVEGGKEYYWGILFDEANGAKLEVQKGTFNQILSWPNVLADDAEVTYVLEAENVLYDTVEIKGNVTLDLNGQTVSFDENSVETGEDSLFTVLRGGKLTINDSKGNGKITAGDIEDIMVGVKLTKYGETATGDVAELVVNNGTIEGYNYGISGNGNRHDTKITINDGTVKGLNTTGIFHPQVGTLTINGGTITGKTGVEMRSGTLNVTGGTIIGTYKPVDVEPNGNGVTSLGVGIAVAQHTTKKNISVNISGGTIKGFSALYQSDPQGNDLANMVSLNVTGGTFEAINEGTVVVYSEDKTGFITGGTYSLEPTAEYIVSPYMAKKEGDVYVIALASEEISAESTEVDTTKEVTVVTTGIASSDKEAVNDVLLESLEENKDLVAGAEVTEEIEVKLEIDSENVSEDSKELISESEEVEDLVIVDYFAANVNVYVENEYVGSIPELTNTVKLTVMLPEELQEAKEGYTRLFYLVREHDGKIEPLEATLSKDGKSITVETDKFSTYAIAYKDVELPPKTGDGIVTYFIMTMVSLIAMVCVALVNKKRFN